MTKKIVRSKKKSNIKKSRSKRRRSVKKSRSKRRRSVKKSRSRKKSNIKKLPPKRRRSVKKSRSRKKSNIKKSRPKRRRSVKKSRSKRRRVIKSKTIDTVTITDPIIDLYLNTDTDTDTDTDTENIFNISISNKKLCKKDNNSLSDTVSTKYDSIEKKILNDVFAISPNKKVISKKINDIYPEIFEENYFIKQTLLIDGSYSFPDKVIYILCNKDDNCGYVIKILKIPKIENLKIMMERELELTAIASNLGIGPKLEKYGKGSKPYKYMYILIERLDGTLKDLLKTRQTNEQLLKLWEKIEEIFKQLCLNNIIHGDFHWGNIGYKIMKDKSIKLYIIDWGWAIQFNKDRRIEDEINVGCNILLEYLQMFTTLDTSGMNKINRDFFLMSIKNKLLNGDPELNLKKYPEIKDVKINDNVFVKYRQMYIKLHEKYQTNIYFNPIYRNKTNLLNSFKL